MIDPSQFRSLVIVPALQRLDLAGPPYSQVAADLLMATAAQETHLGEWLAQVGGPALGVFQQEPATWGLTVLRCTPSQLAVLTAVSAPIAPDLTAMDQLPWNLMSAAVRCRLQYFYATSEPLPADTKSGLWSYYSRFYNTGGAATEAEFYASLATYSDLGGLPA